MLNKLFRTFFISSIFFGLVLGNQADHLLLNRITISPTQAEMVSIFNPTTDIINLSNYYLSDAEKSSTNKHYYNLPTGSDYFSGSVSDFFIRFPDINIEPNDTMFIALHDSTTFHNYYNFPADLSLWNDSLAYTDDNYPFNSSFNTLGDNYESLILFYWDGVSNQIQDVDYFLWGDTTYAINKTGILNYLDDTPLNQQFDNLIDAHDDNYTYMRESSLESDEIIPGNGFTGHDETSENFLSSWKINITPELTSGCTISNACNFNENAVIDDGSCEYTCYGCTDLTASNYVESATVDNGSCNLTANTLGEIISLNVGNECDEDLSETYSVIAMVIGYDDVRPNGGPEIIIMQDESGYQIDAVVWDWDVLSSNIGFMFDPYDPSEYLIYATGTLGTYNCSWQFEITSASNILLYDVYHPQGDFQENDLILKAEIIPAPYVIIPSIGERLDFEYSFPSNSRVIVRIFDLNYRFITSIVDRFYESAGTVTRMYDNADWDGKNHLSQIVDPGTYLIHIEATNYLNGKSSVDIAPIVVGVNY